MNVCMSIHAMKLHNTQYRKTHYPVNHFGSFTYFMNIAWTLEHEHWIDKVRRNNNNNNEREMTNLFRLCFSFVLLIVWRWIAIDWHNVLASRFFFSFVEVHFLEFHMYVSKPCNGSSSVMFKIQANVTINVNIALDDFSSIVQTNESQYQIMLFLQLNTWCRWCHNYSSNWTGTIDFDFAVCAECVCMIKYFINAYRIRSVHLPMNWNECFTSTPFTPFVWLTCDSRHNDQILNNSRWLWILYVWKDIPYLIFEAVFELRCQCCCHLNRCTECYTGDNEVSFITIIILCVCVANKNKQFLW